MKTVGTIILALFFACNLVAAQDWGLIKEPEGVDFIIQSPPLTENERKEISEFIRISKLQNKTKVTQTISKKRIRNSVIEMLKMDS